MPKVKAQRKTLTYSQMHGGAKGMPKVKAQRKTLTYSQMHGGAKGMQEGRGIFEKLGKLIVKGVKSVGKAIKKNKVISRVSKIASPIVASLPFPFSKEAGLALGVAGTIAGQHGFGLPKKIKSLSRNQIQAILQGFAKPTSNGGVSLVAAKRLFPKIKNITPTQMKALASLRGRLLKGGGVSLSGGKCSNLPMSGMGFSGMGVKLAGQGVKLAGQGGSLAGGRHMFKKR